MTNPADVAPRQGEMGPRKPRSPIEPRPRQWYAKPRPANRPLPPSVRVTKDMMGDLHHIYLQADGSWKQCGARGRCRECNKDEAMDSTDKRFRTVVAEHFEKPRILTCDAEERIFDQGDESKGDDRQRVMRREENADDLRGIIELEFRIRIPTSALYGNPPIADIIGLIEAMLAVTHDSSDR